jgi:hypothetical protein
MAVNIGEILSTVTPEPELETPGANAAPEWRMLAEARELHAKLLRDRMRTAAEGFDD